MAHFTCVGATVDELRDDARRDARAPGIENVLALRGDPPAGQERVDQDRGRPRVLARAGRADPRPTTPFAIGAACFPETHIHATSAEDDLRYLKEKVDAGAQLPDHAAVLRQRALLRLRRARAGVGIDVPIIPGIMPITNVGADQAHHGDVRRDDPRARCSRELEPRARRARRRSRDFGVAYATLQCAELLADGAPGIHFYTLNRSPATRAILSALRLLRPWEEPRRSTAAARSRAPRRRAASRRRLVADVDRVVLAVGADAPGAEEPAPAADPVLAAARARRPARRPRSRSRRRARWGTPLR